MVLTKKWHIWEGNEGAAFLFKRHEPTYHLDICSFVRLLITRFLYYKVFYHARKGLNSERSPSGCLVISSFVSPRVGTLSHARGAKARHSQRQTLRAQLEIWYR